MIARSNYHFGNNWKLPGNCHWQLMKKLNVTLLKNYQKMLPKVTAFLTPKGSGFLWELPLFLVVTKNW